MMCAVIRRMLHEEQERALVIALYSWGEHTILGYAHSTHISFTAANGWGGGGISLHNFDGLELFMGKHKEDYGGSVALVAKGEVHTRKPLKSGNNSMIMYQEFHDCR